MSSLWYFLNSLINDNHKSSPPSLRLLLVNTLSLGKMFCEELLIASSYFDSRFFDVR